MGTADTTALDGALTWPFATEDHKAVCAPEPEASWPGLTTSP